MAEKLTGSGLLLIPQSKELSEGGEQHFMFQAFFDEAGSNSSIFLGDSLIDFNFFLCFCDNLGVTFWRSMLKK